ncbi:hypothetical protein [Dyadobacter arcticus]|uniref:Uncharacterized protein n=1 Tax=Dyadobacter arcticus TaxID=1078754 RepID=A0ABX0US98_9BACT|nr:hypothetical protein [Dyadobacter arcticus]NIJ55838.1 hypothetical protein [Dyadobacter arcticus]
MIVSDNPQSNGRKQNALPAAEISALSRSNISDPNYIEPDDPGTGGTSGGDVNFVLPSYPAIDNGNPYVLAGRTGALFTPSGSSNGDLVGFAKADPTDSWPLVIVPSALGLLMGFTFIHNGIKYLVQGYTVSIYNGQIHYWTDPRPVKLVLMSAAYGQATHWVPTSHDQDGFITELAHWECSSCNVGGGTMQGQVKITQLSINAQGLLTLAATVTIPGKTMQVINVNWRRWW